MSGHEYVGLMINLNRGLVHMKSQGDQAGLAKIREQMSQVVWAYLDNLTFTPIKMLENNDDSEQKARRKGTS